MPQFASGSGRDGLDLDSIQLLHLLVDYWPMLPDVLTRDDKGFVSETQLTVNAAATTEELESILFKLFPLLTETSTGSYPLPSRPAEDADIPAPQGGKLL